MAVLNLYRDTFTKGKLKILKGSKVHNFASIAAAAEDSTTITVTGAKLGDYVIGFSFDATGGIPVTLLAEANVTAANTVSLVLTNVSGGAVDLASGTWRVLVLQEV